MFFSVVSEDYEPVLSRTVTFATGLVTQVVCTPVTLNDDNILENEEYFTVRIDAVSPAVVIDSPGVANVHIRDIDSELYANIDSLC